jgi:nucleotide-binding universal stress UspA family protein
MDMERLPVVWGYCFATHFSNALMRLAPDRILTQPDFSFGGKAMRTYLVVVDESEEAEVALRFAARRAAKTGGAVEVLVIVRPGEFLAWGGVQATMEDEAREIAEEVVARAFDMLGEESVSAPQIQVRNGEPFAVVRAALAENPEIGALVLGAARSGNPGPLVSQFTGADAGALPCPVMIIPGSLSREALDRMS